jgi:heme-degrading monooxygenase HmoA
MIRALVGYKIKEGVDILPVLLQLRSSEMTFPGFISSENLQNKDDESTVVTMGTWQKASDWKAWESSRVRRSILTQLEGKLIDGPKVTVYTIMPTVGWLIN